MKILVLLGFLSVFYWVSYGEDKSNQAKAKSIKKEKSFNIDQSLNKSDKEDTQTETKKAKSNQTSQKNPGIVSQKIKKVFIDFLEVLEKESMDSKEYTKAVQFLENSLYNQASFETLKILADTYDNKKDFQNQIKVLNILSASYSNKAESFYLLGMAYKNLYLNKKEKKREDKQENKDKSIENLNKALKLNRKYVLAYEALLSILKDKKTDTDQEMHTKESLSVVLDMLRYLKKSKHYIDLCKAYYDNNFLKQSQKACKKSIKKNPDNPISPLILALSRENEKELLEVAGKFKESFFVQYNTALYFMKKNPRVSIPHFDTAYDLQPENITLNKIMANILFDNKQEEKSYKHFLKACLLTEGKFLRYFRKAKSTLRRRALVDLILKFQKGIDQCFVSAKKKIRDKKQ